MRSPDYSNLPDILNRIKRLTHYNDHTGARIAFCQYFGAIPRVAKIGEAIRGIGFVLESDYLLQDQAKRRLLIESREILTHAALDCIDLAYPNENYSIQILGAL